MPEPLTRANIKALLRTTMEEDERILGVVNYDSESEGRADQWSDIDISLFLRDTDMPIFERNWKAWSTQFGELLKFEANAFARWQASSASWNLEQAITPERLTQLNACIPTASPEGLRDALIHSAHLGREVCTTIASTHQWPWPEVLAQNLTEETFSAS